MEFVISNLWSEVGVSRFCEHFLDSVKNLLLGWKIKGLDKRSALNLCWVGLLYSLIVYN